MWGDILLWFWFAFPRWMVIFSIFSGVCWSSICLLWKNSGPHAILKSGYLFLILSSLYILDIKYLIGYTVDKYLFPFDRKPFHFVDSFPRCAKLFSVVPLLYFCLCFLAWGKRSEKILLRPMSVLPMFSSRSFMVSNLTYKSYSFWVYFCKLCEKVVKLILLQVAVQFFQHHILKRLSFPCILFPLL